MLSSLRAEGPSGVARAPKEDVTSFVIANTRACGVSDAAETGPGTPGVDTTTTACATANTTAGIAIVASRAAPVACTAAPNRGGGSVSEGREFDSLVRSFRCGFGREKEESWVVNPTLVVINVLLNLLDNVVESADRPGEVIHIEVGDYSVLGGALVSVVLRRFDKADELCQCDP